MKLSTPDIYSIIINLIGTYILQKAMTLIFEGRRISKAVELLCYLMLYISTQMVYMFIRTPIILLVINIAGYIALAFLYSESITRNILVALQLYIIFMISELLPVIFIGKTKFLIGQPDEVDTIYGMVSSQILSFMIILLLSIILPRRKPVKSTVPLSYWMSIVIIPVLSLIVIIIIFNSKESDNSSLAFLMLAILCINILVFYIYENIIKMMQENTRLKIAEEQNRYYEKELTIIEKDYQEIQRIKHDIKNHLIIIDQLRTNDEPKKAEIYKSDLLQLLSLEQKYCKTGNTLLDSFINHKIEHFKTTNIEINVITSIPDNINLPPAIITTVFGNLLDNADEGMATIEEDRVMSLSMRYDLGAFIIEISNTFDGLLSRVNERYLSRKKDEAKHGLGLGNVKQLVEENDGELCIDPTDNVFHVEVILFID